MRRLRPEVCLDHRRVFDDRLRAAFGDLHALLDHNDVLGQREDGPHDMLDDQGAEPDFLLDPYEQVHRISEFFGRQSGEDLVEQDDSGPRPEDPPELEPFPFLDGQVRGRTSALRSNPTRASTRPASSRAFADSCCPWFPNITATATFSRHVIARNGFGIWCVFAMPCPTTRWAGQWSIRRPSKVIDPFVGRSTPAIRLSSVDLPDPLGPMSPTTCPSRTFKETPWTALTPPKFL